LGLILILFEKKRDERVGDELMCDERICEILMDALLYRGEQHHLSNILNLPFILINFSLQSIPSICQEEEISIIIFFGKQERNIKTDKNKR
jgi:hypothetical protein